MRIGSASRRLVVTADDFGLRPDWDRAIVDCYEHGVVTSSAVVTSGPTYRDARAYLAETGLDHGIHLCLLGTAPLSPAVEVPSLVGADGRLPSTLRSLARQWVLSPPSLAEISLEWSRQVRRAFDDGLRPTHLSGHYHLHLLPGLVSVTASLARDFGIPWVRVLGDKAPRTEALPVRAKAMALRLASGAAKVVIKQAGAGILRAHGAWAGARLGEGAWQGLLGRLPEGATEIVCHPGQGDEETRVLKSPKLREAVESKTTLVGAGELVCSHVA